MSEHPLKSTNNLKYISDSEVLNVATVQPLCASATWWSKKNQTRVYRSHDPVPQDDPLSCCEQFHVGTMLFI